MKKTESLVPSDLPGKLTRYTALAGAAGLGGSLAQAGITVWTSGASATALPSGIDFLYFDFETGNVGHSTTAVPGADFRLIVSNYISPGSSSSANYFYAQRLGTINLVQSTGGSVARLASGQQINAAQPFGTSSFMASGTNSGSVFGNWSAGGAGYLGFQFDIGGSTHYGWADVTLANILPTDGNPTITLNRFAYNTTPDAGILAGQVPEPESLLPMALLALGAAGLTRYRRQRATPTRSGDRPS